MIKLRREYSVALLVITGGLLLLFGLNFLKGRDLLQRRNVFHAVYSDVSGISEATSVTYNGFKVGHVVRARLLPDGSGRVAVSFQLDEKNLQISRDARAEIYSAGLLDRALRIVQGTSPQPAQEGDTLFSGAQPSLTDNLSGQIDPLKRKAEGLLANVDSVLNSLHMVLNADARGDIDASFAGLRGGMEGFNSAVGRLDAMLESESKKIAATLDNLQRITGTLAANSEHIGNITANVDSITGALANGSLERMMANLESTSNSLKETLTTLNEGRGTLGKLMHDDSLYVNLNAASKELDLLLEDLRLNPNRYFSIFGKKDRLPKLSKSDIERIREAYDPKTTK